MSDHPPGQATDHAATHTIADAARLLGISENAVRKRIRRGTLPARKEGDRWLVALPGQVADHPPATTDLAADLAAPASDQAADLAAAITPLTALIERLTTENRELAEAATVWQVRAHHLEEQMKQLTAGSLAQSASDETRQDAPGEENAADVADDGAQPWWRRWWRVFTAGS